MPHWLHALQNDGAILLHQLLDHICRSYFRTTKVLIGDLGHKNPHDAVFLANGDMVVATYSPGRISYWKKI